MLIIQCVLGSDVVSSKNTIISVHASVHGAIFLPMSSQHSIDPGIECTRQLKDARHLEITGIAHLVMPPHSCTPTI